MSATAKKTCRSSQATRQAATGLHEFDLNDDALRGTLENTTESDIDSVYVSFPQQGRDTCTGIAPERLAKNYDSFFTTKQIGKGMEL